MKKINATKLLEFQHGHLDRLSKIVHEAIVEEELIVKKIANPMVEKISSAQRIADWITWFSGSMPFLFLNAGIFIIWIILNTIPLGFTFFDPYPFGFLTMVVSLEAIFLSCFVLISQNRQEEKDRQRSENDYLINLKSEIEVRSLHQKMDLLLQEQMETLYDTQEEQLQILGDIKKDLKKSPVKASLKDQKGKISSKNIRKKPNTKVI